jgi:hypothetical protein
MSDIAVNLCVVFGVVMVAQMVYSYSLMKLVTTGRALHEKSIKDDEDRPAHVHGFQGRKNN